MLAPFPFLFLLSATSAFVFDIPYLRIFFSCMDVQIQSRKECKGTTQRMVQQATPANYVRAQSP
jgi:hypothetical protein